MAGNSEPVTYLDLDEAKAIHVALMRELGEAYYGLADQGLLDSALARARNVALYAGADLARQAAEILWGVLRNHPFYNGNKRTACVLSFVFLDRDGFEILATTQEVVGLAYGVDRTVGALSVEDVEGWLRRHMGPRAG